MERNHITIKQQNNKISAHIYKYNNKYIYKYIPNLYKQKTKKWLFSCFGLLFIATYLLTAKPKVCLFCTAFNSQVHHDRGKRHHN